MNEDVKVNEVKERKVVIEKEDLQDPGVVVEKMIHFYNLFELYESFGEKAMNEFRNKLIALGWSPSRITELELQAISSCNWSSDTYVRNKMERKNMKVAPVCHRRSSF